MAEKPKTQRETIDQLWYAVIGTNGDGLIGRMAKVEKKLGTGKKPKRLEIIGAVIVALVGLQSLGVFDGIRAGVSAWLAGGG